MNALSSDLVKSQMKMLEKSKVNGETNPQNKKRGRRKKNLVEVDFFPFEETLESQIG